ncbi:MAG: hypothetical protein EZS28_020825 [Streblomastix strix]|uniref:Uncharacterized protein n=1 Tax=Streblomastix strix TaxID=222440 RepID=A0A5J4VM30_9EUKA|nr:MAG: hypothetical protein EZS28_020825 [Streblomastix strix]
MALDQRHHVNQSDNNSSEPADNENDFLVRARLKFHSMSSQTRQTAILKITMITPHLPSTEYDNLDIWQTSCDEEMRNANLEQLRQTRAELYDDSDDETSTESKEFDLSVILRRRLLDDELETEAESSEIDSLAFQDPDAMEILNMLAPTAKKNQRDYKKTAIRLNFQRINQQAKDHDSLAPEFDENHIKAIRERSRVDQSQLKFAMPPKNVEGEKTAQQGSLIRNLVAAQGTNVLAAEAIFQEGKMEAAERILDTFELIGQAIGEAQQLRKQHLYHRCSRFSNNKSSTSAAFSSKMKKAMKEKGQSVQVIALIKIEAFKDCSIIQDLRQVEEEAQEEEKKCKRIYFNLK